MNEMDGPPFGFEQNGRSIFIPYALLQALSFRVVIPLPLTPYRIIAKNPALVERQGELQPD